MCVLTLEFIAFEWSTILSTPGFFLSIQDKREESEDSKSDLALNLL